MIRSPRHAALPIALLMLLPGLAMANAVSTMLGVAANLLVCINLFYAIIEGTALRWNKGFSRRAYWMVPANYFSMIAGIWLVGFLQSVLRNPAQVMTGELAVGVLYLHLVIVYLLLFATTLLIEFPFALLVCAKTDLSLKAIAMRFILVQAFTSGFTIFVVQANSTMSFLTDLDYQREPLRAVELPRGYIIHATSNGEVMLCNSALEECEVVATNGSRWMRLSQDEESPEILVLQNVRERPELLHLRMGTDDFQFSGGYYYWMSSGHNALASESPTHQPSLAQAGSTFTLGRGNDLGRLGMDSPLGIWMFSPPIVASNGMALIAVQDHIVLIDPDARTARVIGNGAMPLLIEAEGTVEVME